MPEYLIGPCGWPIFDDEGRPLDEGRLAPELRAEIPLVYERCPYAGSRAASDKPMNASALDQVGRHLRATLADFGFLRREFFERPGSPNVSPSALWHFTLSCLVTPWFLLGREPTLKAQVPVSVAAVHKIMIGLKQVTEHIAWREVYGLDIPALTADALLECAERIGLLIGPVELCPAPEPMIRKTLDVMLRGAPDDEAPVRAMMPVPDGLFRLGACAANVVSQSRMLEMVAICVARDLGVDPATARGQAAFGAIRPFTRQLGLMIAELEPTARGDEITRVADLMASLGDGVDAEVEAVIDRIATLWAAPARPDPHAVFAAAERAVLDGIDLVRREAHAAVGRPFTHDTDALAEQFGSAARSVLHALGVGADVTPA